MRRWWVSWYGENGVFCLHSPWWIAGFRGSKPDDYIFVAAVQASTFPKAQSAIRDAHDDPGAVIEWRFIEPRKPTWSPFNQRFPRAEWMKWDD